MPLDRSSRGRAARRVGRRGERAARRALRRAGYRVLGRNLRTPHGEVDLLAREGSTLVLVEVKASGRARRPGRRLRGPQRARLRRAALFLARRARGPVDRVRRDLVEVSFADRRPTVRIHRGGG